MTNALDLEKLIAGDTQFRTEKERQIEINKRFVAFFPTVKKVSDISLINFLRGKVELQPVLLTRQQIKETLVKSHLVSEGIDPETATDEALKRSYCVGDNQFYSFEKKIDGNDNVIYDFQFIHYCGD